MTEHAKLDDLFAALSHILDAPKTGAPVQTLCSRPGFNKRVFPERLKLSVAGGIEGDFEMRQPWLKLEDGSADPRIQVSILPSRVLDLVWLDRENTIYPGDTMVADLDTSLHNLPAGTLLKIGTVVLRVSDLWNEGCAKWKVRYGREAYDFVAHPDHEVLRLRGILCSIEQDGVIALGDLIERVDA